MLPAPKAPASADPPAHDARYYVWLLRSHDGLEFARSRTEVVSTILVHDAPHGLDAEVLENGERLVATGRNFRTDDGGAPMARLFIDGVRIMRSDTWPEDADIGSIVLLPGGEAGILRSWSTDQDRARWTWSLEFRGGAE